MFINTYVMLVKRKKKLVTNYHNPVLLHDVSDGSGFSHLNAAKHMPNFDVWCWPQAITCATVHVAYNVWL